MVWKLPIDIKNTKVVITVRNSSNDIVDDFCNKDEIYYHSEGFNKVA